MATKTVAALLAQRRGDDVAMILPRTSADLVGYENASGESVTLEEAVAALEAKVAALEAGSVAVSQAYVILDDDLASGSNVSTQGVEYTPGSNGLFVFYEGVKLIHGENYNEVDGSTIELLFDAESGSTLEFVSFGG